MMEKKYFSIIIPIYNSATYLEKCLNSVLHQSYSNFEVILIDSSSTDNSLAICENFRNEYQNKIRIISMENKGVSAARNRGIIASKGEYIIFIDSDDYVSTNMLESLAKAAYDDPDIIAFQHDVKGIKDHRQHHLNIHYRLLTGPEYLSTCLDQTKMFIMVWKYAYSRDFIKHYHLKFHEGIIHEDEEWSFIALNLAKSVHFIDKILYHYVRREDSVMTTGKENSNRYYIEVASVLHRFIREKNLKIEPKLKKKIKHRIFDFYYYNALNLLNDDIVNKKKYLLLNMTNIKEFIKSSQLLIKIAQQKNKTERKISQ